MPGRCVVPKIVNHSERREEVASAVLAVAARSGLANATLREVAREAGCTTGTVSHYFRDKHDLLVFAFRLAQRRVLAMWRRSAPDLPPTEQVRASLAATLPLDDERRAICAIFLEFQAQALFTADLAAVQRETHADSCRRLAGLVQAAVDAGEFDAALDVERQAEILIAFIVGLAREALFNPGHYTSAHQMAVLDDVLARLAPRPAADQSPGRLSVDAAAPTHQHPPPGRRSERARRSLGPGAAANSAGQREPDAAV
jgi:AcrR family transcriptional regulator